MFKFLKEKLKSALGKFSKSVEKEAVVEKKEIIIEEKPKEQKIEPVPEPLKEKKGFFKSLFGKKEPEEIIEKKEELIEELEDIEEAEAVPLEEPIITKPAVMPKAIMQGEIKAKEKLKEGILRQESAKEEIKKEIPKREEFRKEESKREEIKREEPKEEFRKPEAKREEIRKEEPKEEFRKPEARREEIKPAMPEPRPVSREPKRVAEEKEREKYQEKEKKSIFTRITETFTKFQLSEQKFEELFWDLELAMLENNVAVEVIGKIKRDMKSELMKEKISRSGVESIIASTLKDSIVGLFDVEERDLIREIMQKKKQGKPYIITVIGVNGSGKTTTIAKLTRLFQKNSLSVVLAASDTFRAAAIQQLEEHAERLGVKLIKHDYNSDPAAVAFDAIKYAGAKKVDVVVIDTAGRLHSNTNLMEELKKVVRVCKPDIKIFVGESITGNDCVEQAKEFDNAVGIDAIILAKADVDEKGGAAISVSYVTRKPIIYLGTGQNYEDLRDFNPKLILESLEL